MGCGSSSSKVGNDSGGTFAMDNVRTLDVDISNNFFNFGISNATAAL